MLLRVNGETRQRSHSGNMSTTIAEILSHYSPLGFSAGDVLSTGTVSGVAGSSPDAASLYLQPGDVIEAEIERIGVLRNPVVSWQAGARGAGSSPGALVDALGQGRRQARPRRAPCSPRKGSTLSSSARPTTSST